MTHLRSLLDMTPGQMLGRYELLVPIAQGGMAAVWAAQQRGPRGFKKIVAIKTMLPHVSDDPRFEQMFLDEARVASRIRHPNVVQILDLGEENEVLYLVMEWVDGESLGTLRRAAPEQRLPLPVAVRIAADACAGLHVAHELTDEEGRPLSLVHRDVSPQNILVGYDGVVRITDFGVAKVAGRTSETTTLRKTRGKPPYMAPEQARGRPVDRRADVFALGIVLYQLTTGRHPFRGETDVATLHNILADQPIVLPTLFDPAFPKSLEGVIARALARDPQQRTPTARELMAALDEVSDREGWRVRSEDVSRIVNELLAERGEERRRAIRESIRVADAEMGKPRANRALSVTQSAERSAPEQSSAVSRSDDDGVTSLGATTRVGSALRPTGSRRLWAAGGALVAVGIAGGALGTWVMDGEGGLSGGGAASAPGRGLQPRASALVGLPPPVVPSEAPRDLAVQPGPSSVASVAPPGSNAVSSLSKGASGKARPSVIRVRRNPPSPKGAQSEKSEGASVLPPMSDPGF